jgi:hypothetical protein
VTKRSSCYNLKRLYLNCKQIRYAYARKSLKKIYIDQVNSSHVSVSRKVVNMSAVKFSSPKKAVEQSLVCHGLFQEHNLFAMAALALPVELT